MTTPAMMPMDAYPASTTGLVLIGGGPVMGEATAAEIHANLLAAGTDGDPFDRHVLACILALAWSEAAAEDLSLTATTGLDAGPLGELLAAYFPQAAIAASVAQAAPISRTADETCLRDLLRQCCGENMPLQMMLSDMIARRAQSPNHLWQDLGLFNRSELSRLMARHFPRLAARNTQDMKWKKFLYRTICRDAAYQICTAPSCAECDDFDHCFGDESGESRLAQMRRDGERGAA